MRTLWILIGIVAAMLLFLVVGVWLLSGPSSRCPASWPDPAAGATLEAALTGVERAPTGAPFQVTATAAELESMLAGRVGRRPDSPVAGMHVEITGDGLALDVCLRDVWLFPTPARMALSTTVSQTRPIFTVTELRVGRLPLPAPIRRIAADRLSEGWRTLGEAWLLDRVELGNGRITVAGRRR
jgi:hypothetical protein